VNDLSGSIHGAGLSLVCKEVLHVWGLLYISVTRADDGGRQLTRSGHGGSYYLW